MSRGTDVGKAYVKVEINGDGMNEDIVDEVDKSGRGIDKVGEKHGEDYGDGFEGGFFDRLKDTLSTHLEEELDRDFKNMGRRLGNSLSKSIGKAMGEKMDEIEQSMARLVDTVESKVSGNGGSSGGGRPPAPPSGGVGDGTPDDPNRSFYAAFEKARAALHTAANKMIGDADKSLLKQQQTQMSILVKAEEAKEKAIASMQQENAKIVQRIVERRVVLQQKSNDDILKSDRDLYKQQQKIFDDAARDGEKRRRDINNKRVRDSNGSTVGDAIGDYRSRNNAIFLVTQTLSKVVKLAESAQGVVGGFFKTFAAGASEAAEAAEEAGKSLSIIDKGVAGLSKVGTQVGSGLGEAFGSIIATGPGVVVAIGAVILASSVLVSVLGALLAIITALIATIVSALVGALAVAAAGLFAIVGAAGLVVLAFLSMTKAQKEIFKTSFLPFLTELKGIGGIIISQIVPSFATWNKHLTQSLDLIAPFTKTLGLAVATAGNIFTGALSGPGFQQFAVAFGTYLPGIITNLATAFGGFLNGALSIFALILPYVDQFAAHLSDVATRFAAFASGTDGGNGPNRISDFVGRAITSLQSLWNFVQAVGGVISRILFSAPAQNFGNGLFDGLTKSLNGFKASLTNAKLEKWFADASSFAKSFAAAMKGVVAVVGSLYNSGVLSAVGLQLRVLGSFMTVASKLISASFHPFQTLGAIAQWVSNILYQFSHAKFTTSQFNGPLGSLVKALGYVASAASKALSLLARVVGAKKAAASGGSFGGLFSYLSGVGASLSSSFGSLASISIPNIGSFGGGGGGGGSIPSGPKGLTSKEIKAQMKDINDQIKAGLDDAAKSSDPTQVQENFAALVKSIKDADKQLSKSKRAKIDKAATKITAQGKLDTGRVNDLILGIAAENATLADYASARQKVAAQLADATTALSNATSLRDNYKASVTDAINTYGALTTSVAQTLGGIQQALTTTDITTNLQTRLDKIKAFQSDLQILLAQGLSNSAYKQIVDAGVDAGTTLTQALLTGGGGAVGAVNSLVDQINDTATSLGGAASSQLYQAGVDAAQGLVDGLTSLSAQLDAAATALGNSIAKSIKKALGIKSPSTVMYEAMGYVGDGIEDGLDAQHIKVGRAADRLSSQIEVSPEAAAYANANAASRVSGNSDDPRFRDLIVQTPTEDPQAVAMEVLNEVTGRL